MVELWSHCLQLNYLWLLFRQCPAIVVSHLYSGAELKLLCISLLFFSFDMRIWKKVTCLRSHLTYPLYSLWERFETEIAGVLIQWSEFATMRRLIASTRTEGERGGKCGELNQFPLRVGKLVCIPFRQPRQLLRSQSLSFLLWDQIYFQPVFRTLICTFEW